MRVVEIHVGGLICLIVKSMIELWSGGGETVRLPEEYGECEITVRLDIVKLGKILDVSVGRRLSLKWEYNVS